MNKKKVKDEVGERETETTAQFTFTWKTNKEESWTERMVDGNRKKIINEHTRNKDDHE